MQSEKNHELDLSDDETNASLSEDEFLYLNAGYVHYDDDIQSGSDWEYNLEVETGINFG